MTFELDFSFNLYFLISVCSKNLFFKESPIKIIFSAERNIFNAINNKSGLYLRNTSISVALTAQMYGIPCFFLILYANAPSLKSVVAWQMSILFKSILE